jgi:protein disulfide-isomerase A6
MIKQIFFTLIIFLFNFSQSSSDLEKPVINLDSKTFEEKVLKSKEVWLILFYSENNDFNKLKPEYEKAALAMNNIFNFGAINIAKEKQLALKYKINTFPFMLFFGTNKDEAPKDFVSSSNAVSIIEKLILRVQSLAKSRINIKDNEAVLYDIEHDPDIVVLNDQNFDEVISKNESMWLIAIYSPRCGVCHKLLPHWQNAAKRLKNKAVFAILDGTINQQTTNRFQVSFFPLIKIVSPGFGRMKKFEDYNGPKNEEGLVEYTLTKYKAYGYVKDPPQIINQDILNNECVNQNGYCIITLFPKMKESNITERNTFIYTIKTVAKNYKSKPVHFLWAKKGDFNKFENNIKIKKYPVTIAVDFKNKKFSYKEYPNKFNMINFEGYIKGLLEGKENLMEYKGGLEANSVKEWDRRDSYEEDL